MKISKNKKMRFFLMSQGSFNRKISFLGQEVCSVAREHTDRQTDRQTDTHTKVTTVCTLSGFQEFFPSTYHQESAQKKVRGGVSLKQTFFGPNKIISVCGC